MIYNFSNQPNENANNDPNNGDGIFKKKLDTEFPLSGGETEEDWKIATSDLLEDDDTIDDNEEVDEKEFKRRLNTEFPLSGGETEA